jgi:hypothetical protein
MIEWFRQLFLLGCMSALGLVLIGNRPVEKRWWKGNTHTHTLWSDGDAPPEWVAHGYKSNGYQFLVLSDHNLLSTGEKWVPIGEGKKELGASRLKQVSDKFGARSLEMRERGGVKELRLATLVELRKRFDEPGRFLFIQGEEITDKWNGIPLHHNSINQANVIPPPGGTSVRDVMQKALAAVKAEGERNGRPILVHLNHPNWKWAISPDDLAHVLEERCFEDDKGEIGLDHFEVRNYPSLKRHLILSVLSFPPYRATPPPGYTSWSSLLPGIDAFEDPLR